MLTLTHNWKTYRWIGDKWGTIPTKWFSLKISDKGNVYLYEYDSAWACHYEVKTYHTPEQLAALGYMEEIKPLSQKRAEAIERGKEVAILEKLREDLEERIKEYKGKLSTKKITKQTTQDKILLIRINELEVVLIVLTSLSSEEQPEDPKGKIYREWVEKEKKHFFEQYKDLLPEEQPQFTPWQEEPETVSDKNMIRINKYDFTPWQEIEVSNDSKKWQKREFSYFWKWLALASPEEYQTRREYVEYGLTIVSQESWRYARPLPLQDKIELPEFSYDRCDEENNLVEQVHEIGVQVEALTTFSQALARQKTTK